MPLHVEQVTSTAAVPPHVGQIAPSLKVPLPRQGGQIPGSAPLPLQLEQAKFPPPPQYEHLPEPLQVEQITRHNLADFGVTGDSMQRFNAPRCN